MWQPRSNEPRALFSACALGRAAIIISAVVVLGVSATVAWLLHTGVGRATAQGGERLAATMPDRAVNPALAVIGQFRRDHVIMPPRIERISIAPGRPTLVEGAAPALASVVLLRGGEAIGQARARPDGSWLMSIDRGLGLGDHRLQARATPTDSSTTLYGDGVRVSMPRSLAGSLVISLATGGDAVSAPAGVGALTAAEAEPAAAPLVRFAEAPPAGTGDGGFAAVRDWLQRADRSYQEVVVKKLSTGSAPGQTPAVGQPAMVVAQAQTPTITPPDKSGGATVTDGILDWLKRSSDTYQKAIVKRLAEPTPTLESLEAKDRAEAARKAADAQAGEIAQQTGREELRAAQAKRDAELKAVEAAKKMAEDAATKSAPAAAKSEADAAAQRAAEDKRIADETLKKQADLKAAEDKRAAEAKAAEAKKAAEETAASKAAEDKRLADEASRRAAELKAAEEKRAAEAKAAEAKKAAEETAASKAAEDKRLADEASRRAAELKAVEAKQAADEAAAMARVAAQEATQRAAAEAKRAADMAREAELKRLAELKAAEDTRRAAADAAGAAAQQTAAQQAETRRKAAELAEAASREAAARIAASRAAGQQVEPQLPSVSTGRPQVAERARSRRAARAASAAARRLSIDTSSRSALGAGRSVAAPGRHQAASEGAGCRNAGRRIKPPGYYVVKAGDSLWDIADLHYDSGARLRLIARANRKLEDPDLIKPCQRLFIPVAKRG